jgi:hypothetical protein
MPLGSASPSVAPRDVMWSSRSVPS